MSVLQLPDEIVHLIIAFLPYWDGVKFGSCCSYFYEGILKDSIRQVKIRSDLFYDKYKQDERFRQRFNGLIRNPSKQLNILRAPKNSADFPFKEVFTFCLTKDLKGWPKECQNIEKITTLESSYLNEIDLGEKDYGIKHLAGHSFRPPLPILPHLSSCFLSFDHSRICSQLLECSRTSALKKMTLLMIDSLVDVSMLNHIEHLEIIGCYNLTDISPLNNNYSVCITSCSRVLDYTRSFRNTKKLSIDPSSEARIDYNRFESVHTLEVMCKRFHYLGLTHYRLLKKLKIDSNCISSSYFTLFTSLTELTLEGCKGIEIMKGLGFIRSIKLYKLLNLASLDGLGFDENPERNLRNRVVIIEGCNRIDDFSPLNGVDKVGIVACQKFRNFEQVNHVKDLTIESCLRVYEVRCKLYCNRVTLIYTTNLHHFESLQDVPILDVRRMFRCLSQEKNIPTSLQGIGLKNEKILMDKGWFLCRKKQEGREILKRDFLQFVDEENSQYLIFLRKK